MQGRTASIALFILGLLAICISWRFSPAVRRNVLLMKNADYNVPTTASDAAKNSLHKSALSIIGGSLVSLALTAPALADAAKPKKAKKPKVLETESGIKYIVLKQGSGLYPGPGDFVIVSYEAFLNNGTLFDSTQAKGRKPVTFRMGKSQVIPGLESVVEYMQPGGEVTCVIPSKLAYGTKGVCTKEGCLVPPNEDLKYAVKLISVGAGYN